MAALAVAAPAPAVAHGGAAQLALLTGDTSYPRGVSAPLRRGLDGMVRDARARGYGLKVALVGDVFDVERSRVWLYDPQAYADYLSGLLPPGERVLTVHPNGFGGNALGEKPALAISELRYGELKSLDELVRRALRGVAALTAANGTPVTLPRVARPPQPASDGSGPPVWLVVGAPLLLLGTGVLLVSRLLRTR